MMVTYGNASGAVPAVEPLLLNQKGSLFLTRPTLAHHCASREELNWRASDVLNGIASGDLKLQIHKTYPLSEVHQAHEDLAARKTTGKLLLDVNA
jgi:NADPH2:quinone reductase